MDQSLALLPHFPLLVRYGLPIKELFDNSTPYPIEIDREIDDRSFPPRNGVETKRLGFLLSFPNPVTWTVAGIALMHRGLRPGEIEELVAIAEHSEYLPKERPILGLGSFTMQNGARKHPILIIRGRKKAELLLTQNPDTRWPPTAYFLGLPAAP